MSAKVLKQFRFDPETPKMIAKAAKTVGMSQNSWVEEVLVAAAAREIEANEQLKGGKGKR